MILILGGAYAGKERYAREHFSLSFLRGEEITREEAMKAQGLLNLEKLIYREMKEGREVSSLAKDLIEKNPSLLVTVQEVGCGVVPMDPFEREYREAVGRISCELAAFSSQVIRLIYGIPQVLKP